MSTWAIAEVTDSVPDSEEYGDYRGLVLLCDDQWEQNLSSVDEGVAAFAQLKGSNLRMSGRPSSNTPSTPGTECWR